MKIEIKNPMGLSANALGFFTCLLNELAILLHIDHEEENLVVDFGRMTERNVGAFVDGTKRFPSYMKVGDDLSLLNSVRGMSHEMVHIKQHMKNELKPHRGYMTWKGDYYENGKIVFYEKVLGFPQALPWEKEAYDRMDVLAHAALDKVPAPAREYFEKNKNKELSSL